MPLKFVAWELRLYIALCLLVAFAPNFTVVEFVAILVIIVLMAIDSIEEQG